MTFGTRANWTMLTLLLGACGGGGGISGTYANPDGNVSIEFMKEGKAHISMSGLGGDCTYTESGKKVAVTCEGETTEFTLGDDGALSGPPEGLMSRMIKKS